MFSPWPRWMMCGLCRWGMAWSTWGTIQASPMPTWRPWVRTVSSAARSSAAPLTANTAVQQHPAGSVPCTFYCMNIRQCVSVPCGNIFLNWRSTCEQRRRSIEQKYSWLLYTSTDFCRSIIPWSTLHHAPIKGRLPVVVMGCHKYRRIR